MLVSSISFFKKKMTFFWVPIAQLLLRLGVAYPFFNSGVTKLNYILNGQLDTLYFLFEDYHVPLLPVQTAALMATVGEIILPILLGLGFFGRVAAIGLLIMTAVIFNADGNPHAVYWAVICFYIAVAGAGKLSVDHLFFKRL